MNSFQLTVGKFTYEISYVDSTLTILAHHISTGYEWNYCADVALLSTKINLTPNVLYEILNDYSKENLCTNTKIEFPVSYTEPKNDLIMKIFNTVVWYTQTEVNVSTLIFRYKDLSQIDRIEKRLVTCQNEYDKKIQNIETSLQLGAIKQYGCLMKIVLKICDQLIKNQKEINEIKDQITTLSEQQASLKEAVIQSRTTENTNKMIILQNNRFIDTLTEIEAKTLALEITASELFQG
jgi:hypothetical protein